LTVIQCTRDSKTYRYAQQKKDCKIFSSLTGFIEVRTKKGVSEWECERESEWVCERERESEWVRVRESEWVSEWVSEREWVSEWERERERERKKERKEEKKSKCELVFNNIL